MKTRAASPVGKVLGTIPNRLQLAGGWIDQPFVSRHNPQPPGSMVVVQIDPDFRPMDRSGIASGTRAIAMKLWKGRLPDRPPEELVRELYDAENKGKAEPSGLGCVGDRFLRILLYEGADTSQAARSSRGKYRGQLPQTQEYGRWT